MYTYMYMARGHMRNTYITNNNTNTNTNKQKTLKQQ